MRRPIRARSIRWAGVPQKLTGTRARPGRAWTVARVSLDASMLFIAAVATTFGSSAAGLPAPPPIWLAVYSVFVLGFAALRGLYGTRLRYELLEELRAVVVAASLATVPVLLLRGLMSDPASLWPQGIRAWAFAAAYLAAGRVALHWSRAQAYRHGESFRPTLIIGAGKVGRLAASRLLSQPQLGLKPIGFLDKEPLLAEDDSLPLPVLGASWDLDRIVEQYGVEQVVITFSRAPHEVLLRLVKRCEELGVQVAFVPRLFEKMTSRLTVEHFGGLPLISARSPNPKGLQFAVKYAADRVVALGLLLLALPVMIPAAIGVLLTTGRPLFFRQVRVGRDGRTFAMLKFRTMRHGETASAAQPIDLPPDTAPGGVEGGDRRTKLGAFLRKTSIDELPQLINVAQGRDEPDRPASRAPRVRRTLRGERLPLRRPPSREVGHHRLGAGARPARQDVPLGPRGVGQLLHRELVALARPQGAAADRPRRRPHTPGRVTRDSSQRLVKPL